MNNATQPHARRSVATAASSKAAASSSPAPELPAGYEPVGRIEAPSWDFEAEPQIEGVVVAVRAVCLGAGTKRERTARVMNVRRGDGSLVAIWESATLSDLFDRARPGDAIAIVYRGEEDVGRPQPMRRFVAGIRPRPATGRADDAHLEDLDDLPPF